MNKIIIVILLWMIPASSRAQTQLSLSIDTCYELARKNYPLIKQMELIVTSTNYSLENAAKGYYPRLSINGQATYQSDVTQLPVKLPNTNIPEISKDQYKIYGDISQTLYDGGMVNLYKESILANASIEKQNIEIELYKLKERINNMFFGILLLNEQLLQTDILKKDLKIAADKTRAAIVNGMALKSNADELKAEELKINQHIIELKSARKAFVEMLSLIIGRELNENYKFETPSIPVISGLINRPELLTYVYRSGLIDLQLRSINAHSKPKVNLFIQGGYGRPALNMLKNEFNFYYIGGLRFSWSLSGLYTSKKEKNILGMNHRMIETQKETFLFNTNLTMRQQNVEIVKFEELIKTDNEIVELRTKIKNTSLLQFENGIINTGDYLRECNAEDEAIQNRILHEIQLLMTQYKQQNTSGN